MALINKIEDKKQIVRRYMDYPKFLTLLTTESIYFAKPNEFKDPLDALCPKFIGLGSSPEIKQMDEENYEKIAEKIFQNVHKSLNLLLFGKKPTKQQLIDSFDNYVMSLMLNNIQVTSEIYIKYKNKVGRIINMYIKGDSQQALKLLRSLLLENSREREISLQEITGKRALISCWQICEEESDLMWQCYTKSDGIMIETTVEKLENLNYAPFIDKDASCIIDKVKYINLSEYHEKCNSLTIKDNIEELNKDFLYNYFVKSKSLSDEKELRILIAENILVSKDIYNSSTGRNIKINMNIQDFIDKIVISPYAQNYYLSTLKNTVERFGLNELVSKISKSAIKTEQEILLN